MDQVTKSYRFCALIHRLSIQKNLQFNCHIVWKRHSKKSQTTSVKHAHGYSIFQQKICLDLNIEQQNNNFKETNTEFVVLISLDGKIKSGGIAKYDVSKIIGKQPIRETIHLAQCPDPEANLELTLSCEIISQQFMDESQINVSSRDLNHSRLVLDEKSKMMCQIQKIKLLVQSLNELNSQIKINSSQKQIKIPQIQKKIQTVQGQKRVLENQLHNMEEKFKKQQQQFRQQKKQLNKQISEMQKQLAKKNPKSTEDYKLLYQKALNQLQQLRQNTLKDSLKDIRMSGLSDVKDIAVFQNDDQDNEDDHFVHYSEESQKLKAEKQELQTKLVVVSHQLAKVFNASFAYGGQKLLDYLQTAVGIIE